MDGKYIYGIIRNDHEGSLPINGIDSAGPVYTTAVQGLGCILSDYSGNPLSSMSKEEMVRCLLVHQVVVEHAMKEQTVLPVKFGTILSTLSEVRSLLFQGHQQFVDALAQIADKVEVEVAATWDIGQVLREIGYEEEIMRTREAITSGREQTLEQRVRLGQMVKASMDRRRDNYRQRMIDFLEPIAVEAQPNALVSDEMVMNVAFLVEKANQGEFDRRVRQLNTLFRDQISFRIVGPLPPYSFATVEAIKPSPERIEEARRTLQLSEAISEPEVRKAYRRLAARAHPDQRPGDETAKLEFTKLRHASDLLIAYCRGQAVPGGFLIRIGRSMGADLHSVRPGNTQSTCHD